MTTTENSRADALTAATLADARSALYGIAKTYDDSELRAKALEAYEATFSAPVELPAAAASSTQRFAVNDAVQVLEQNWEFATAERLRDAFPVKRQADYTGVRDDSDSVTQSSQPAAAPIQPEPRTAGEAVYRFGDDGVCRIAPSSADEGAAETLPAELVERILRLWEDYPGAEFADRLRAMTASGEAAAPAYAQGSDELQPRTPGEKAAYLEGVEEGRMRAVRDGQVMGSSEEVLRRLLRARGLLREFVDHGLTTSRVQRARELLEDGQ
ncbi:TPA: hypothetical protein QDB21_005625 [Burkholderia vietnamiensis]|nr:hypothetical protein [Burkholderia vietnamiensis]